jgi:chemotaxis protein MotB
VVAGLTFVAAYYIPLFRAHKALVDEFRVLMQKQRAGEEQLTETRRQLDKESKEKQALKSAQEEKDSEKKVVETRLGELGSKVAKSLGGAVSKGQAQVDVVGDEVHVTLANGMVFKPHTLTIPQAASKRLCEIAQASSGALRLTALAESNEPPSVLLKAKYPTARALSAARAAIAAADLESHCQVEAHQLMASSVVYAGAPKGSKVKLPALRIELLSRKEL